jgi:hypothetical protein
MLKTRYQVVVLNPSKGYLPKEANCGDDPVKIIRKRDYGRIAYC